MTGPEVRPSAAPQTTAAEHLSFTIITPVMNGVRWLEPSVRSVAIQRADGVEVEHIVLDAGSTDGSREWLTAHRDEFGYVTVFEPDDGQTDALIKGFARASGEILGWLNADDLLEPGALRRVADAFASDPETVMVSGAALDIDGKDAIRRVIPTPPVGSFEGLLTYRRNPAQPATFFRRTAYETVGGLDRRYSLAMDLDLWLKLARLGRIRLLPSDVLARFRVHDSARSMVGMGATRREDISIRRRHGLGMRTRMMLTLILYAYVRPALRPLSRTMRRLPFAGSDTQRRSR